jgi:hypothetical protein
MEFEEAIRIIRSLSNALDPETQQALPPEAVCRRPACVKALNRAVGALIAEQKREQERPIGAGKYWSGAEDAKLCEELRTGSNFREIAKLHNRTEVAIVSRLMKLGKLTQPKSGGKSGPGRAA